ncbi:hypothetical protein [Fulvimarina sp. MAC8]|uniref:hypothetical protein n=1 Tax=Fulvimarina sp. MAC8 TaxID=3162874 RepID=UPI0032EBC500
MFSLIDQKGGPTEREKLQVTYLNGLAIGVGPLVNAAVTRTLGLGVPVISLAGFGISYYVHRTATRFLKVNDDER